MKRRCTPPGPSGTPPLPEGGKTLRILVATPVLNGMPHLPAAVASVAATAADAAAQGVAVRHVVQLSAASADGSREWLNAKCTMHNAQCIMSADAGMYDAISRAFSGAAEDVLCWLNADEQHLPGAYAAVAAAFDAHPETDVVFGDYLLLDAAGRPVAARRELPIRRWHLRQGVNANLLSCAVFFRRRVWESLGGFDVSYTRVADSEFFWRALEHGFRFRHLNAFLGAYGLTGRNLSLDQQGRAEPARLRERTGAWRSPVLRALPKLCRIAEKAVRGCYLPCRVRTRLFDADGKPVEMDAWLGSRWRWPEEAPLRWKPN